MGQGKSLNIASSALRERRRDELLHHVDIVDAAVAALREGTLEPSERSRAEQSAAAIAEGAADLGLALASDRAREIEADLRRGNVPLVQARRLSELVQEVRRNFEHEPQRVGSADLANAALDLLLVGGDELPVAELQAELQRRGLRVAVARASGDIALRLTAVVAVVDLRSPLAERFMSSLGERHEVVIGVAEGAGAEQRTMFQRRGGRLLLAAELGAREIAEAAASMHERLREDATHVMIVDDDPVLLGLTAGLLRAHDLKVTTLDDGTRFWQALEERHPDVLLLDLDMPGVDGLRLCQAVRANARWRQLPLLFLTERRDADSVRSVFAAGADDYLNKPIVEEELVQRIRNRLARARLLRDTAERDTLTGVANRRKVAAELRRLERLADRFRQPLALALVDVDRLKHVNDTHGHDAGDEVLRRLSRELESAFRGEDAIGRWGGEEFVIGMYGVSGPEAADRLRWLLEEWKHKQFEDRFGSRFAMSFTAGVAEMPANAGSLEELQRSADQALSRAKAAGRGRVESAPVRGSGRPT